MTTEGTPTNEEIKEALRVIELAGMLDVECCHITGEHNPTHFEDGKYVCSQQMADTFAFLRIRAGLTIKPDRAYPKQGCGWCEGKGIEGPVLIHSMQPATEEPSSALPRTDAATPVTGAGE